MSYFYPQAIMKLRILPEDYQLVSDASLQKPLEAMVQVRDLVVNVNDHKTADSFTAEIDFKNFPFDPRTIRSCGVVIYLADTKSLFLADGSVNKLVPQESNVVFQGFVDQDQITLDENKRTVHFEGRDFSSLFIDQKYKEQVPININQKLDTVLALFLSTFKATQKITLWWREANGSVVPINKRKDGPLPVLSQYYPDFSNPLAGQRNPGTHESYWDIMWDLVQKAGMIMYINLDKLILTNPRNLYNDARDAKFIYGINVKSLSFKRKLGRFKNFNLMVRSRVGKEVLTARIPEDASQAWCNSFGIEKRRVQVPVLKPDGSLDTTTVHDAPFISFPVSGIGNQDQLVRIGQSVFEDYSRQQLEGSIDTNDMLTHAGVDQDDKNYQVYDLTQLDIGQPLEVEIASDDIMQISRLTDIGQRTQYLIQRGYSQSIAGIFAKTLGKFRPRFYTKSYTLSLNQDSGFKFHAEIINIIETRFRGIA